MFRVMTRKVNLHNAVQKSFAQGFIPEGETFIFTREGMKKILGDTSPTSVCEPFRVSSFQHGRVNVARPMGYGGLSTQILEHVPVQFITTERAEKQRLSNKAKRAFVKGVKSAADLASDTDGKVSYLPNMLKLKPDTATDTDAPKRRTASISTLSR